MVAAGAKTITDIAQAIPTSLVSFDPYVWIVGRRFIVLVVSQKSTESISQNGIRHDARNARHRCGSVSLIGDSLCRNRQTYRCQS